MGTFRMLALKLESHGEDHSSEQEVEVEMCDSPRRRKQEEDVKRAKSSKTRSCPTLCERPVIATCGVCFKEVDGEFCTVLSLFCVALGFRQLGIGEALVLFVKRLFQEKRVGTIVVPATESAVKFWTNYRQKGKEVKEPGKLEVLNYNNCTLCLLDTNVDSDISVELEKLGRGSISNYLSIKEDCKLRLIDNTQLQIRSGRSKLMTLCRYGTMLELEQVLEQAEVDDILHCESSYSQGVIFDIIAKDDEEEILTCFKLFFEKVPLLNINTKDENGQTPLFYACNQKHWKVVKRM